jgi:hypothetical protein
MAIYKRVAGNLIVETLGNSDTVTFQGPSAGSADVIIDGDLSVTGNASLLGNIAGDKIFNGTTSIEIQTPSGNANISVGGVANIAVFSNTGVAVLGTIAGNSTVSAAGNVIGSNLVTSGNVLISRDAGAGQPTVRFNDTDIDVADGQVFGAVEWFTNDDSSTGARVTAAVRAVAAGVLGNANVQILTSTGGAAPTPKVTVLSTGNVGVANVDPVHTFAVSGTIYGSSTLNVDGNVTGGNISTAGRVTATGNLVTAANAVISGFAAVTGNVTAANVISAGLVSAGAAGVVATGNVRGGNVISDAAISATGNISASNFFASETVSATGNVLTNNAAVTNTLTVANIVVSGSSSGDGIGVENTVRQNTLAVIEPSAVANVGGLGFTALADQSYKFSALLPVTPEGSTTATFALQFSSGACNYVVEAQETAVSVFSTAASNTSDSGISRTMTGTDLRFVRISGTFFHTSNVDVAVRASTNDANLNIAIGSYFSHTRIA